MTTENLKRLLEELAPEGVLMHNESWQARKSSQTRHAILQAAIQCLVEQGYARVTTQMIAETAGVSRGATMHHYGSRLDLIEGAIQYIFWARADRFTNQILSLSESERRDQQEGLELFWNSLNTDEFVAEIEIRVATRTDPDLKVIWEPALQKFNKMWTALIDYLFPEWKGAPDRLQLAMDMVLATHYGLFIARPEMPNRARRVAVRQLLNHVIHDIRDGVIDLPDLTYPDIKEAL